MAKILVIDDDSDFLLGMHHVLASNGFEVDTASKWHDVFQIVDRFKPDIIILDVYLSGIDGRNICKELKKEIRTRHIPVIMISGDENIANDILAYGAADFIAKPIQVPELLSKVNQWLNMPENV